MQTKPVNLRILRFQSFNKTSVDSELGNKHQLVLFHFHFNERQRENYTPTKLNETWTRAREIDIQQIEL